MEPKLKSEKEKRKYITREPVNLFVEAGAGAGKTHEMMNRIVNRIARGSLPEHMVVITFTNAATEEMVSRLRKALNYAASSSEYTEEEKARLSEGYKNLDSMTVSTIHAFCYSILQEYSFEAGLPFNLEVLDDDEIRKKQIFDRWFIQNYQSDEVKSLEQLWKDDLEDRTDWIIALRTAYLSLLGENGNCKLSPPDDHGNSEEEQEAWRKAKKIYETFRIAKKIRDYYQKEVEKEKDQLSNDQLLIETDKLLRENPEVRKELQEEYQEFFVDEFQDTDPIQMRIIWLLVMDESEGSAGSLKFEAPFLSYPLRDCSLFVVGDPKQSIYRFRGAQVEEFNKVKDTIRSNQMRNAAFVELSQNFRTDSDLVQKVNQLFGNKIPEYQNMTTPPDANDNGNEKVQYFPVKGILSYHNEAAENNCQEVVETILTLMQRYPTLHYSDFLVITRGYGVKGSTHNKYIQAFESHGIPISVKGDHSILDPLASSFMTLLEFMAASDGPFHDLRDGPIDVMKKVNLPCSQKKLNEIREKLEDMSPSAAIRWLLDREELYLPIYGKASAQARRTAKIHLTQVVEQVLAQNPGNLYKIYLALEKALNSTSKTTLDLTPEENAVRLMNVHQVKGLEGNIVIIADHRTHTEEDSESDNVDTNIFPDKLDTLRDWPDYYPCFKIKNGPCYISYLNQSDLVHKEQEREQRENRRLEYVAFTRARHAVIFVNHNGASWFDDPQYQDSNLHIQKIRELHNDVTLKEVIKDSSFSEVPIYFSVTPSSCEKEVETGLTPDDAKYIKEDRPIGNIFGLCFHRAMELLLYRRSEWKEKEDVENKELCRFLAREAILEYADEIEEKDFQQYYHFLTEQIFKMMSWIVKQAWYKKAAKIYTEYPFVCLADRESLSSEKTIKQAESVKTYLKKTGKKQYKNSPVWIIGTADLLVQDSEGKIAIYDYKTDAKNGRELDEFEDALKERYGGQMALYKFAIHQVLQSEIKRVQKPFLHLYKD